MSLAITAPSSFETNYGAHGSTWPVPGYSGTDAEYLLGAGHNGGQYYWYNLHSRWDTSGLNDSDPVLLAAVAVRPTSITLADSGQRINADWYNYAGAPGSGDWANSSAQDALADYATSGLVANKFATLPLLNPSSVNRTGTTGLRFMGKNTGTPGISTTNLIPVSNEGSSYPPKLITLQSATAGAVGFTAEASLDGYSGDNAGTPDTSTSSTSYGVIAYKLGAVHYLGFLGIDTSALPDAAIIDKAYLLARVKNLADGGGNFQAEFYDYGAGVDYATDYTATPYNDSGTYAFSTAISGLTLNAITAFEITNNKSLISTTGTTKLRFSVSATTNAVYFAPMENDFTPALWVSYTLPGSPILRVGMFF